MQSLIENAHPGMPEDGHEAAEGEFASEAERQAAVESWQLMQLVQKGRAEGASQRDIQKGEQAFAEIYDRYYPRIFSSVYRRVNNHAVTEDIVTDTFLRAFKSVELYDWQGRDLGAWLHKIATNLVIDHSRNAYVRYVAHSLDDDGDVRQWADESRAGRPEAEALGSLQREELLAAIRQLSELQQKVIVLRYLEERSITETAEIIGKSEESVKGLAHRAIRALRTILERQDQAPKELTEPPRIALLPFEPLQLARGENAPEPLVSADGQGDEEEVPETIDEFGDLNWEGSSLLGISSAKEGYKHPFISTAHHGILSSQQVEELAFYIALGKEAQDRLAANSDLYSEEREELQSQVEAGARARRVIAAHNLRLVVRIAMGYRHGAELDDLIQAGNAGLVEAADRHNPYYAWDEDGPSNQATTPFSAIAHGYIRGYILRHLRNERRTQSLRSKPGVNLRLLQRVYEEGRREKPNLTYAQAGEWLGLSAAHVERILGHTATRRIISLDAPIVVGQDPSETIPDASSELDFRQVEYNLTAQKFWEYLGKHLKKQEYMVLREYYVNEKSQQTIADEIGQSRQNVTRIIAAAQQKVKVLFEESPDALRAISERKRGKSKRKDGVRVFFRKLGAPVAEDANPDALRVQLSELFEALSLTPAERAVAELRYGLGTEDGTELSQQETAEKLGLSRGYVSKLDPDVLRRARIHFGLAEPEEK